MALIPKDMVSRLDFFGGGWMGSGFCAAWSRQSVLLVLWCRFGWVVGVSAVRGSGFCCCVHAELLLGRDQGEGG